MFISKYGYSWKKGHVYVTMNNKFLRKYKYFIKARSDSHESKPGDIIS